MSPNVGKTPKELIEFVTRLLHEREVKRVARELKKKSKGK